MSHPITSQNKISLQPLPHTNREKAEPIDHFLEQRLSYKQLMVIGSYDLKLPYLNTYHIPYNRVLKPDADVKHIECYYLMNDGTIKEAFTVNEPLSDNIKSKNPNNFYTVFEELAPNARKVVYITGIHHGAGKFTRTAAHFIVFKEPTSQSKPVEGNRNIDRSIVNTPYLYGTSVQIPEKDTVLTKVQDLLDIELSPDARKVLSFLSKRRTFYMDYTIGSDEVIKMAVHDGLMVIGLDGHGNEIYYTRNATGNSEAIDIFEKFKPYRPRHVVAITNIKGAGVTDIYNYKKPLAE